MKSGASTNLLLPHFKMIHFEADFKEREMEPLAWLFGMPLQIVFNILSFSEKERYYVTFCNSILRTTKPYLRCTICTTSRDKKPNTSHLAVCSYVSQFYSLFYILVPFVWGPYKSWNLAELWYQLYVPPAEHFNLCLRNGFFWPLLWERAHSYDFNKNTTIFVWLSRQTHLVFMALPKSVWHSS